MNAVHALADTLVLEVVRFRCGPWHLALPARDVRGGYRLAPGEAALPIEALLPAADPGDDPGTAASTVPGAFEPEQPRHGLWLQPPGQPTAQLLSVQAPLELQALAAAHIHPLPAVLAARCRCPGLRALALESGPQGAPGPLLLVLDAAVLCRHAADQAAALPAASR